MEDKANVAVIHGTGEKTSVSGVSKEKKGAIDLPAEQKDDMRLSEEERENGISFQEKLERFALNHGCQVGSRAHPTFENQALNV
ncbi:hypothetical protein Poli38472_007293 [Pythium oligandrum]|uniref:Uncharacterized protein n=1 Tax=Pythium oligandrum TaxID=41045 RepID=A0A8K1C9Z1_PYTOL|nr:hypothetical protein Poli38472_007293 [Pythium oligandrum]|eukprot:TMW59148.1 hypothetical protein Poli38472_007293 [Pythium oligandrum]